MTSSTASEPIAAPDTSAELLFPLHLPEDVAESGPVLRLTTPTRSIFNVDGGVIAAYSR